MSTHQEVCSYQEKQLFKLQQFDQSCSRSTMLAQFASFYVENSTSSQILTLIIILFQKQMLLHFYTNIEDVSQDGVPTPWSNYGYQWEIYGKIKSTDNPYMISTGYKPVEAVRYVMLDYIIEEEYIFQCDFQLKFYLINLNTGQKVTTAQMPDIYPLSTLFKSIYSKENDPYFTEFRVQTLQKNTQNPKIVIGIYHFKEYRSLPEVGVFDLTKTHTDYTYNCMIKYTGGTTTYYPANVSQWSCMFFFDTTIIEQNIQNFNWLNSTQATIGSAFTDAPSHLPLFYKQGIEYKDIIQFEGGIRTGFINMYTKDIYINGFDSIDPAQLMITMAEYCIDEGIMEMTQTVQMIQFKSGTKVGNVNLEFHVWATQKEFPSSDAEMQIVTSLREDATYYGQKIVEKSTLTLLKDIYNFQVLPTAMAQEVLNITEKMQNGTQLTQTEQSFVNSLVENAGSIAYRTGTGLMYAGSWFLGIPSTIGESIKKLYDYYYKGISPPKAIEYELNAQNNTNFMDLFLPDANYTLTLDRMKPIYRNATIQNDTDIQTQFFVHLLRQFPQFNQSFTDDQMVVPFDDFMDRVELYNNGYVNHQLASAWMDVVRASIGTSALLGYGYPTLLQQIAPQSRLAQYLGPPLFGQVVDGGARTLLDAMFGNVDLYDGLDAAMFYRDLPASQAALDLAEFATFVQRNNVNVQDIAEFVDEFAVLNAYLRGRNLNDQQLQHFYYLLSGQRGQNQQAINQGVEFFSERLRELGATRAQTFLKRLNTTPHLLESDISADFDNFVDYVLSNNWYLDYLEQTSPRLGSAARTAIHNPVSRHLVKHYPKYIAGIAALYALNGLYKYGNSVYSKQNQTEQAEQAEQNEKTQQIEDQTKLRKRDQKQFQKQTQAQEEMKTANILFQALVNPDNYEKQEFKHNVEEEAWRKTNKGVILNQGGNYKSAIAFIKQRRLLEEEEKLKILLKISKNVATQKAAKRFRNSNLYYDVQTESTGRMFYSKNSFVDQALNNINSGAYKRRRY